MACFLFKKKTAYEVRISDWSSGVCSSGWGLVVDRYGPVLVIQCLTLGMVRARPTITTALTDMFGDTLVFNMDEEASARLEGFSAALEIGTAACRERV